MERRTRIEQGEGTVGDLVVGPLIWISGLLAIFIGVCCFARWSEMRCWNGGRCRGHNERWKYFDTDSQGGRGYKFRRDPLSGPRCVAWMSWPGVES